MADTLERRLYNTLRTNINPSTVQDLIEQGVDCNLSYFDDSARTFISPIQIAAKNERHGTLCLLYKHRNSPTKTQLEKHLTFYINHYILSREEDNEILFDYIVSRLLYTRITKHSKRVFDTLIAALHGYDKAELHGKSLCNGSTQEIFLQLRIYTLFRRITDMTIKSDDSTIETVVNEFLHNLETYYFLHGISHIPVVITKELINTKFAKIKPSQSLLIKYYKCIAENVIDKIGHLNINQEYTIPTGWIGHAVCVSFRRISRTHISIRVDNPASRNPASPNPLNAHEIIQSAAGHTRIKPKVLGQLHIDDLEMNLDYFISLIDSVRRDLKSKEGTPLIYNHNEQIRNLDRTHIENMPSFDEQANANCFVKCFEPGFSIRFGLRYPELSKRLLLSEKHNTDLLMERCIEERMHGRRNLFNRFIFLAREDNTYSLPVTEKTRLQDQLKRSYEQNYQYLLSNTNRASRSHLIKKYIPLQFKKEEKTIKLKDFFIKPHVLLIGEAGCGKTTICQYVTYQWAHGRMWQNQFEWLFYIKMRNLNSIFYPPRSNNYSLIDIIERECLQGYMLNDLDKQKLRNLFGNPSNILWILDGCDERMIPDHLGSIERELLHKPYLLLTSRSYQTYDLPCDDRIQIQRFENQDIKKYISEYFPAMFRSSINEHWSSICCSQRLEEAARVPACLEIICSLWDSGKEVFEWGMTTGDLYQKMCEYLLRRYLLKFHRQCTSALAGKEVYKEPNAIAFTYLEYMAFKATKSHIFTIKGKDLVNVAGSLIRSVLQTGLLIPETQSSSRIYAENTYYFVHRSFQEYLCAHYMINALSSACLKEEVKEVIQFITNEKYNRHLQNTFRLFFELKGSKLCNDQFWSAVDSEPRDLIGFRHCSRIIRWFPLGSCVFSSEDERQQQIDNRTINVVQTWISKIDRPAHDYGNIYLFDWFGRVIDDQDWLTAWKDDLFMEDSPGIQRRYFLPELWSTNNINTLKQNYDNIRKNVEQLHRLITKGPTTVNLTCLNLDPNLFTLYTGDDQDWLTAWRDDLFMEDSPGIQRRYFLPDLWSTNNINTLKQNYDNIRKNVEQLHRLITKGPTTANLTCLNLDPNLFTLYTGDDQTRISDFVETAQKKARERQSITTLSDFQDLLRNYVSFSNLNRRSMALGEEIWGLKIDTSALENINNDTLNLLLRLSEENALFFRYVKLPVISFLKLYSQHNDLNDDILRSLIVSITLSSECLLTAPPGEKKVIRVYNDEKIDDKKIDDKKTDDDIELNQQQWDSLIITFDRARHDYGFSFSF